MSLITPHGGKLVNREAQGAEREALLKTSATLPSVTINARAEADLELIAIGALSPLEGFLGEADYLSVRDNRRLANGLVWSIPITLSATAEEHANLKIGEDVALKARNGQIVAILHLAEIYTYDKQAEAEAVYRALGPSALDLAYRKGAADNADLDRLARPEDLDLLFRTLGELVAA